MPLLRRLAPTARSLAIAGLLLLFGLTTFSAGIVVERRYLQTRAAPATTAYGDVPPAYRAEFDAFLQTWRLVRSEYYYRPVDQRELLYGATRGMLATLGDDYTTFLEPAQQQGVREAMSGDYEGIGVWIETPNGRFTVAAPMKGAPADLAGIRARDVIVQVDGRPVTGLPQDQVITLVRGKAGTAVRLTIERPGTPGTLQFTVTRAVITIPAVTLKMLDGNVAYISVTIFGDKTTAQLDAALKDAHAAGATGIVLDLRDNGGGWVVAAREMLGRFVDPSVGPALYEDRANGAAARALLLTPTTPAGTPSPGARPAPTIDATGARADSIIASTNGVAERALPLVVLVNGGTASASEIVAGALQDYGRAKLVGTATFGKGSIQSVHEFSGGSSARITIAQWLTPRKRVIQQRGIHPDILVERGVSGDGQLDRALEYLRTGR